MKLKTFILTFLMMSCSFLFGQQYYDATVHTMAELQSALNATSGYYVNVTLGQSFAVTSVIEVDSKVTATLDLNGYTLSADNKTYVLNNLGKLTIKDSSTEGTGTIEGRGIYNGSHGSVDDTDLAAVLTIESGIFKNTGTNGGAAVYNLGTAYINGGTFYGEYAAIHNRLAVMHIKNVYIIGKTINSYGDFRNSGALYIGENVYFYGKYSEEKNGSHSGEFTYLVAKIGNAYYATLQDAINAKTGETVTLIADCAGDVTVTQAPGYAITIDGDDNTFKGTITVDGKSARYETTALTIKNVNFDATEGITYDACIRLGNGTNATRYTNKVTVENCTFTDNDYSSVAVKSYTGGDYNLVVKDCEANGMHSLLQLANVEEGLIVDNCTANTKNGLNLGSSEGVVIKDSEISVQGYAVRIGASSDGASGAITLENNTLKTNNSEGDAVIVVRGNAVTQVDLSMKKNVVSGTTHISGNTAATKIAADENYWDGKEAPVVAEGSAPIVVNSYYADEDLENLVRNEIGSIYAFVLSDRIFGEVTTNAIESIKIEIIGKDGNVIGSSTLEKTEHATGFNNTLTWRINLGADDSGSWAMAWNEGAPSINNMPAKVKLYVDDAAVAEAEIKYTANGDGQSPVFAAKTNAEGKINSFIACDGAYNLNNAANKLVSASADGDNIAILTAGTYNVPTGKNLTITGAVENVKFDMSEAVGINSSMTFNNVTFEYGNANYVGLQHAGTMVYNNCIINGQVFLYGTSETFNNCTFNQNSADAYNVWTYGAAQVAFNECTFNSAGKSVLIYAEGANIFNDVTVTDCDFIASSPVEGKAAIEMDSSLTAGINLTIDGETTADGFGIGNASGNSLWNNKKGNNDDANNDITVVVDGETVLEPIYVAEIGEEGHRTLQEAIGKAVAGDNTIQLLANIEGDVTILQQEGINIVIDGKKNDTENYTFNGIINIYGNARHTGTETLTIQNIDFYTEVSNTNAYYFINALENGSVTVGNTTYNKQYAHNVTVKGCNFTTSEEDTDNQIVGIGLRQTYNIVVDNCTAKHIFSLMWGTAVDGLKLNQVTLEYATEGITLAGASKGVEIKNSKIVSPSYGIRAEGTGSAFTIENSTLEAKVPVVVRKVNKDSKPSFTFKGTNTITESNPTSYWFVAGAGDAYQGNENEPLPETAGQVSVTLNDTNLNREGIYGSALNGEGTEEKPYLIETVNDLVFFRDRVNGGNNYAGKYVKLDANIDLSSIENWTPIGDITYNNKYQPADNTKVFSGEFNGNDKVISNLKIEKIIDEDPDTDANVGLFGITGEGAVIKNLTLTNVDIKTSGRNVGALAGFAYKATLDNITVNGDIKIEGGNNVSGVAGMTRYYAMSATNIKVIGNDGSTIVGNNIVGGIFAEIAPNGSEQTFKNLSVENVAINGVGGVGGIVGLLTLGTVEDVTVKNVALTGNTLYQGNPMGRIRLGSVSGLMGSTYATIANVTTENVTAKNLEGTEIEDLPIIGANYGAATNATEAKIGDTYYNTLQTAINKANNGETIELLANVNNNVTFTAVSAKELTLDLNGYTITSKDISTITVSNGNHVIIEDSSEPSTGMIVSTADNYEAIAVKNNGNVTFVSGTAYHPVNGVYLYTGGDNNKFTMTGGTIKVDDNGMVLTVASGEATVKGGNLLIENMNLGGISALAYYGTINIEGGNISNIAKVETSYEGKVSITGGTFTFANNETFVKGTIAPFHYAVENENGTFTVIKNDVVLNGTGVENDPYLISNVNELMWFRDYVNLNGTEVHAALANDIDMSDLRWVSIGTSDKKFTGTFDGRDYTLSNLNADDNECGLFRYTHNATVKNLTIENVTVIEPLQDHNGTGAVIGVGSGTTRVENVTVKGKIAVAGQRAGAIVGYVYSGLYAENCHVIGSGIDESYVNAFYWASGGIIGFSAPVDGHSEIKNCSVKDIKIWAEYHYGAGAIAGTFKGLLEDVTAENVNVIGKYDEESNGLLCGYQKATGNSYAINSTLTVGDAVIENPCDIVAKIGDNKMFCTLEAAATVSQNGETIQLIWAEGNDPIAMAATFVGNKTVTITGEADVDWDKGWLYVGRNGEGNGKLIFKEANLTSKSVGVNGNGIGLNVSCKKEGQSTTNDGEVEIIDSHIQLDYLIGKGNIKLDNSTLNVYEGFAVGARPASETGGVQRTVTMDITNGSNVIVNNHNGQGLGYESKGIMNIDATSTFETTQNFLVTADGTMNNAGTVTINGTLTNNGTINFTSETATLTVPTTGLEVNNETGNNDIKVVYENGTYKFIDKHYVAEIVGGAKYETLAEAIEAVAENGTVKLIDHEIFTEDNRTCSSGTWYEGVYYVGDKNFTIDLNNYTVTQNGAVNDYMFLFKNDGEKDNTITLKNGTIDAGTENAGTDAYCAICTSTTSTKQITINTENINFVGNNSNGAVLKIRGGAELNVKAGTVITGEDSYLGIESSASTVNIYEGAEIYMNGTTSYNGCLVGVGSNGTINVYGGKGTGVSGGFIAMTSGGTINVYDGEWIANTDGTDANSNKSVLVAQSDKQNYAGAGNSIVNVSGGVFKGGYNCYGNAVGDAQINISGGIFSVNPSGYCAENHGAFPYDETSWVVREIKGEQTIALQANWNWMSSYISEFDTDGLTMLTTKLGENGVQIKNNLGSLTNGGDYYGWYGTLNAVSVKEMYKVNVVEAQEFKYEGNYVNYDECVIPLYIGWNYIGYPVNEEMPLADALANLDANAGDVIKSQTGTAIYTEDGWVGFGLDILVPGEGYMYQNTSNSIKELSYTTKKTNTSTDSNSRSSMYWTVDATQYPSNMTMIAMTDVEGGDYEVAAFVNGELRGSSRPIYVESLNAHILVLTISGDDVEEITFKYYDITTGEETKFSNRINYTNDAIVGSMDEPYMLTRGTTGIGEAAMSQVNIYPNPTTTGTEINLEAVCDTVEVFNALGVKVAEYQNVDSIDALETAGIYVIRITNNGNVQNCRLVVK